MLTCDMVSGVQFVFVGSMFWDAYAAKGNFINSIHMFAHVCIIRFVLRVPRLKKNYFLYWRGYVEVKYNVMVYSRNNGPERPFIDTHFTLPLVINTFSDSELLTSFRS